MTFPEYTHMPYPPPPPRRRGIGLMILLLALGVLLGAWVQSRWLDRGTPALEPRLVQARGELAQEEAATIDLFRVSSPSVVYVRTVRRGRDAWTRSIYEIEQGTGSGFVWDNAGHIVTNFHVVQNASFARVTLWDHTTYDARIVGRAPAYDLAILRIDAPSDKLRPIPVGSSSDLHVGQRTFAIGNPFGLDQTLTTGIVSALGRQIVSLTGRPIEDVIQTDAAINPGNSGGPLLDSAGRLIGVNTAIYSPSGAFSGIGFAVPVDTVNRVIPQLVARGKVTQPYMGVQTIDSLNRRVTQLLGVEGVMVARVEPGSPAAAAGLRGVEQLDNGDIITGDIITAVNGRPIRSADELLAILERQNPGDVLTLSIWRRGQTLETKLTLEPPRD